MATYSNFTPAYVEVNENVHSNLVLVLLFARIEVEDGKGEFTQVQARYQASTAPDKRAFEHSCVKQNFLEKHFVPALLGRKIRLPFQ